MVETRVEDQPRQMAPSLFGGGRTFLTEEDLQAAFPRTRNCDAGIDFGGDVVLAEVVSGTVKVQTRELADVGSFLADAERIVLGKARQLYITGGLPAAPAPTAILPGQGPAVQDLPIVVISGQFPVNPLTVRYEQLTAEGHRPDGTVQPLTVLDLEELEGCRPSSSAKATRWPSSWTPGGTRPYRDARLPQLPRPRDRRPGTRTTGRRACRPDGIVPSHSATTRHARRLDTCGEPSRQDVNPESACRKRAPDIPAHKAALRAATLAAMLEPARPHRAEPGRAMAAPVQQPSRPRDGGAQAR